VLQLGTPFAWSLKWGFPTWGKQAWSPLYSVKSPAYGYAFSGPFYSWKAPAFVYGHGTPFFAWKSPSPSYGHGGLLLAWNDHASGYGFHAPLPSWKSPAGNYGFSEPFFAWKGHAFAYGQNGTHANGKVPALKVDVVELARRFESATVYDRFTRYEHYAQSVFRMFWPYGDAWITMTPGERPEGEMAHAASP
jgi:hypothetical protein